MDEILREFFSDRTTPLPELGAELRLVSSEDSIRALCRYEDMESRDVPDAAFEFLAQMVFLALYRDGQRMFPWVYDLKQQLDRETIIELAGKYSRMMDDISDESRLNGLKTAMKNSPGQRMKWRVMRQLGALPAPPGEMTDRDYIYCAVNMMLDDEEDEAEVFMNPAFDHNRFAAMKAGKRVTTGG